ncbi:glycosyltransferase family 4 protein [Candidatus Pacearchaeota archaeon]|nr:glycosyltransferase family 4 protein [Candidatus Pacearchaeota archaeon]
MKVTLVYSHTRDPAANKVAEALSRHGHQVKLLVWDRGKTGKVKNGKAYATCRFGLKAPYDKLTVLFYLPIWWAYEFLFLLRDSSDIIHACNLDTLMPALPIKLIKRVKLCYTVYDFYADNLPAVSPFIPNIVRKAIASLEKLLIRYTDILFLVDESRYEQVRGAKINKLVYIYNSPSDYFNVKDKIKPPKSASESITVLFYAGVISKTRGLQHMIDAIAELDDVKLVIAGTSQDGNFLQSILALRDKVQYVGGILHEDVIRRELDADILFAFYDPKIPNNRYASPNKLFEAMMCGKPIIINIEIAASRLVQGENCGLVVPYGDVKLIKQAVIKLKDDTDYRTILGANGRKAYEARYSWDIMKGRLINAYDEMAKTMPS